MVAKRDIRDLIDMIRRPLITEKATMLLEDNKYLFEVSQKARKPEIKQAIEALFDVKVVKVHTQAATRKTRRVGRFTGHRPMYKRAIVTLAEGDSIVLFPEV